MLEMIKLTLTNFNSVTRSALALVPTGRTGLRCGSLPGTEKSGEFERASVTVKVTFCNIWRSSSDVDKHWNSLFLLF